MKQIYTKVGILGENATYPAHYTFFFTFASSSLLSIARWKVWINREMTGLASRIWFQEETKILYLPSQLDGPCSSSSPIFGGWMSEALSRMRMIFLRFSCNIHNVVRRHGGGGGTLPLYFVCVVSCIILWPTAGLTLCFRIPAEWNMAHTKEQTCQRRYKVSIVWKAKVRNKTQKHSAQISSSADILLLVVVLWEERSEVLLKPGWCTRYVPKPTHCRSRRLSLPLITLGHTKFGRTPLDEGSAGRRDLYLTTHIIHKRQTLMPPGGIRTRNPSKLAAAATGIGPLCYLQ